MEFITRVKQTSLVRFKPGASYQSREIRKGLWLVDTTLMIQYEIMSARLRPLPHSPLGHFTLHQFLLGSSSHEQTLLAKPVHRRRLVNEINSWEERFVCFDFGYCNFHFDHNTTRLITSALSFLKRTLTRLKHGWPHVHALRIRGNSPHQLRTYFVG